MKGAEPDLSAATYQIHDETHTIGNALRWMLMKKYVMGPFFFLVYKLLSTLFGVFFSRFVCSPAIEFCGYR